MWGMTVTRALVAVSVLPIRWEIGVRNVLLITGVTTSPPAARYHFLLLPVSSFYFLPLPVTSCLFWSLFTFLFLSVTSRILPSLPVISFIFHIPHNVTSYLLLVLPVTSFLLLFLPVFCFYFLSLVFTFCLLLSLPAISYVLHIPHNVPSCLLLIFLLLPASSFYFLPLVLLPVSCCYFLSLDVTSCLLLVFFLSLPVNLCPPACLSTILTSA